MTKPTYDEVVSMLRAVVQFEYEEGGSPPELKELARALVARLKGDCAACDGTGCVWVYDGEPLDCGHCRMGWL